MYGTKYTYIHLQARVVEYSNIHTRMLILYKNTNPSLLRLLHTGTWVHLSILQRIISLYVLFLPWFYVHKRLYVVCENVRIFLLQIYYTVQLLHCYS
jgi:hypothetical protein